jgi:thiol:disulfide interchange protein DsbD
MTTPILQNYSKTVALLLTALVLTAAAALPARGDGFPRPAVPAVLTPNAPRTFLMPEEAFHVAVERTAAQTTVVRFTPAEGYYLYRDRIKITASPASPVGPTNSTGSAAATAPSAEASAVAQLVFPAAESKEDPSFGRVWVYHHPFEVVATWPQNVPEQLAITYQGCADHGICYPPTTLNFKSGAAGFKPVTPNGDSLTSTLSADSTNPDEFLSFLKGAGTPWVLATFFGFGLLLALTPCVFPMIPVLSSIIAGQGTITAWRGFTLSFTYVLGMALTYALAGVLAGLSGTLLSNALQTPPVLIATALLFVLLALSMFDVYHLQFPHAWQNYFHGLATRHPGGRHVGVALMGALSALVIGPCVAAPLAGGLLYIAQTHDVVLGGSALFVLALGMGMPLLVVGTSESVLLPRAGRWMVWVKRFFGLLLLAVALWMVWPLLGVKFSSNGPHFEPVHSVAELDQALVRATAAHQPVLLDFYADWCVSCVEMERQVFTQPEVKTTMEKALLLRADVTRNEQGDKELLARFGLFGPPGTIFFDRNGHELNNARMVGYVPAPQFLIHLQEAFQ